MMKMAPPPPRHWTSYVLLNYPGWSSCFEGHCLLAELSIAMFVIGRRDGQRLQSGYLYNETRISRPRNLILSMKRKHFSALEYPALGDLNFLYDIKIILRTSRHMRTVKILKSLQLTVQYMYVRLLEGEPNHVKQLIGFIRCYSLEEYRCLLRIHCNVRKSGMRCFFHFLQPFNFLLRNGQIFVIEHTCGLEYLQSILDFTLPPCIKCLISIRALNEHA